MYPNIQNLFIRLKILNAVFTLLFIMIFWGVENIVSAQPNLTERIVNITSGNFPIFLFNTYTKLENGLNKVSYTKLNIHFNYTDGTGDHSPFRWKLSVMASTDLSGTGGNTMNLNKIYLSVSYNSTCEELIVPATQNLAPNSLPVVLTGGYQDLILHGKNDITNGEVVVSYYVGETNQLLGEAPDYYVVYLDFYLSKE